MPKWKQILDSFGEGPKSWVTMVISHLCNYLGVLVLLASLNVHVVGGQDCESDEWQCDDGECIDASWKCDGEGDCDDDTDESTSVCGADCAGVKGGGFACADGRQCIRAAGAQFNWILKTLLNILLSFAVLWDTL